MSATSTGNSHQSPATHSLIEQTPRLSQELVVRQARAVGPLARERPITVNVGTALRSFYADVLKQPLPPELARLYISSGFAGSCWVSEGNVMALAVDEDITASPSA